ncbi:PepSY domain-containing protein [Lysinibacillus xylanilyticus]|uniref:PepSY domain-containing protein n=1 Tax=Lysinibacillus xylanilyticus TaxID=582475 RepID=UPI003D010076
MKKWLLIIGAIILLCSGALWFVQYRFFHVEPLSKEQAIHHIETIYNGHVTKAENQGNEYEMLFTRDGATYMVMLDATTQQIKDLKLKEVESKLPLTEEQIRHIVEKDYGEIESVVLADNIYTVRVEREDQQRDLTLDAYTGDVLSKKDVEPVDQPEIVNVISKEQAMKIALQQLNGEVDSVDYKETEDGGFYLVEIETKNEEAVFQIHAISGKVMSVTWDEDH